MAETDTIAEIKKLLDTDKIHFGTGNAMKSARQGELAKVFVSSNAPAEIKQDLEYYSGLSGFAIQHLSIPNDELGTVCRKSFSISVISVKK